MAQKISVIIPNYNGEEILKKNLPEVVKYCTNCVIIIVDDASNDNSVSYVKDNFKSVRVLENKKNVGFAQAVNRGVEQAKSELVVLLNSDVLPKKDFIKPALKHFKDKKTFAVGFTDLSHEQEKIVSRGRGGANFSRGFVNHYKLPSTLGETFWVSGGSGIYDRKIFLELGGFDPIYKPFYWEDIDLSFRAWRAGYRCLFEPAAKVEHFHEKGAIKKSSSSFFIRTVSYKNQIIFTWKNITSYYLTALHLVWLPYHFAKAFVAFDPAFFTGLFWAIVKIPTLVLSSTPTNYKLSEMEVLSRFEKQ